MIKTTNFQNNQLSLNSSQSSINSAEHHYMCSHCLTNFKREADYKLHYKSELHQYNLKRRMLDLPPISEEQFNLQFYRDQSETSVHSELMFCTPCGKSFATRKTLNQHLKSKKHQEKTQNGKNATLWKHQNNIKDSESEASKNNRKAVSSMDASICLFCDLKSQNASINLEHMRQTHGFFLVQEEYLKDERGLINYLGQMIHEEMNCITCFQLFKSAEAVQKHMIDKQHCQMNSLSTEQSEILTFYDFTKHLKVIELSEEDEEDVDIEDAEQKEKEVQHQDESGEYEELKLVDKESTISEWEINGGQHHAKQFSEKELEKKCKQFQQFLESFHQKCSVLETGEIQLENGKVIGHRDFKKYYGMHYRDMEEYSNKQTMKMLGDSTNTFKMRQMITGGVNIDEQQQQAIKSQKKEYVKQQNQNLPRDLHNEKVKQKLGSEKMNGKCILVTKQRLNV